MKKIIKNINRIISRLNHDFKNYHVFSVIKSSSKKFSFKKNLQAKISNKFIDRISAYALYLKTNEPIKKNNDLWSVIENQINHKGFIDSICDTQKNNKELIKVLKDLGKTKLLWGYGTNRKSYNQLSNKKFKEDEKRFFLII